MSASNTAPGTLPTSGGFPTLVGIQQLQNQFAALDGLMRQVVAGKAFCGLVQVVAVHGGGTSGPPTVDVQPLVDQVNVLGARTPHGVVHGLPVFRLQAGASAIIVDPVKDDIGDAVICDRDISTVKSTGAQSGPGSFRTNSWSDGCYFGGFLNGRATRYLMFSGSGTSIVDPSQINLTVGGMGITITASGTTIDGKLFLPHTHTGVQSGGSNSGPVT